MKATTLTVILIAVVMTLSVAHAQEVGLLTNGGFERNGEAWSGTSNFYFGTDQV